MKSSSKFRVFCLKYFNEVRLYCTNNLSVLLQLVCNWFKVVNTVVEVSCISCDVTGGTLTCCLMVSVDVEVSYSKAFICSFISLPVSVDFHPQFYFLPLPCTLPSLG